MRPDTPGLPKDLAAVLSGCGKGGGPMPDCIPSMHPRQGMRAFFEGLEKSLPGSVNVRKSTPVTRIMPLPGGGARLSYDASAQFGEEEFEAVVVAVRPSAALQMLPPDHPATSLYAGYFTGGLSMSVTGCRAAGTCSAGTIARWLLTMSAPTAHACRRPAPRAALAAVQFHGLGDGHGSPRGGHPRR